MVHFAFANLAVVHDTTPRHTHTGRVETMAAGSGVAPLGDEVGADFAAAAAYLRSVRDAGGRLHILSGAGMSVSSGVPVFRNSDGTMSDEFLAFLSDYNAARTAHGLPEVDDWFGFSVPQMFAKATEKAAWAYWRWRTLRAMVTPTVSSSRSSNTLARRTCL